MYKMRQCTCLACWLPEWLSGKESACQVGDTGSIPGLGKSPGEGWQPTPLFLLGKSHGQRILVGDSPWGRRRVEHDLATKQQEVGLVGLFIHGFPISGFSQPQMEISIHGYQTCGYGELTVYLLRKIFINGPTQFKLVFFKSQLYIEIC